MTLLLIVPAPVSTNALYANVPGKGRRKTRAYRSWIDAAGWEAKVQLMSQRELIPPLHSRVEMAVELPPGLDVDNIKALGDLMQRIGVVANDRDIEHLDVWRRERADVQIRITAL